MGECNYRKNIIAGTAFQLRVLGFGLLDDGDVGVGIVRRNTTYRQVNERDG
jgi:hypothetical protein